MQLLCFYAEPAEIADISGYGARLGQALAQAIRDNLTQDKLPPVPAADGQGGQSRTASDGSGAAYGRLYYNIAKSILDPTLRENYRLVNAKAEAVQLALDELMNVHLKVQHADFPKERADTIIGAASVEDIPWAETLRRMTSPVENISQSFADDFIQTNAEFRHGAGFDTYVERTGGSGCCAWCAELSGKFNYPDDIPENVFARHDNCTCAVSYKTGGMHHDPHTNLKLTLSKSPPLRLDDSMQAAAIANSNRVLEKKYGKGLTSGAQGGIIQSGAISGALNPESKRAKKHAAQYYEFIRNITTDTKRIAKNTNISLDKIEKIKQHVFIKEHDLIDGRKRFEPSFDMAVSWQKLIQGNYGEKEMVLLKHEYAELRYMEKGMTQDEAHIKASKRYNYSALCE